MHFQTFSIVVGTKACNASCPFCISKQTGLLTVAKRINWRNFNVACRLASKANTTTVLLTGKGEPTLYPDQIRSYLEEIQKYDFPLIEMQTNGFRIATGEIDDDTLKLWHTLGLTTLALSVVHWDSEFNRQIYVPNRYMYYDLGTLISKLHGVGFSVRLCVMMLKGYVDSPVQVGQMIDFAKVHDVEQLTLRNITPSEVTENPAVTTWTREHALTEAEFLKSVWAIRFQGTPLQHLMHGMDVYDFNGQNVCLGNCLTRDTNGKDEFRQLIFFPDGSLYYDWQFKGARIL